MTLENKNILLISPEPWNHLPVSKHHYAITLAKLGNKVYFLNPPSTDFNIKSTEYNYLKVINYKRFKKGLRYFPAPLRKYLMLKRYIQLQKMANCKFDIIWSFDNSVFFDYNFLKTHNKPLILSHIVDYSQDFNFEISSATADLCLGVTCNIVEKQKKYNLNSHFINHGYAGVDIQHTGLNMPGKNAVKALYAGNLQLKYIDWNLLHKVIENFTNVDFLFAGTPFSKDQQKILSHENVHYLGLLKKDDLLNSYENVDILILAYKDQDYPEQLTNSHKVMEYFGSGKVIISTWLQDYEFLKDDEAILMNRDHEDYIKTFRNVCENLLYYNNENLKNTRIKIARDHLYINQIQKVADLLK